MRHVTATLSLLAICLTASAQNNVPQSQSQTQDASALEEQYKTCAKHYIPADKCTPEIYQQLKAKDDAPLDPNTAAALATAKWYQKKLLNPASMQVHEAYVTDQGNVCLHVAAQNKSGGISIAQVVSKKKENVAWSKQDDGISEWKVVCMVGNFRFKLQPGTDVTEKVNQALKDGK